MTIVDYLAQHYQNFSSELRTEIAIKGRLREVQQDQITINLGDTFTFIPLIVEGVLKVNRVDENGNEHFLYFLYPGQSCTVTLNCCLNGAPSEVIAIAEEDVKLIEIPINDARDWMEKFADWRNYLLETYQLRFHELLLTVDQLAFQKLDNRIMNYLKEKAKIHNDANIHLTHSQIAEDFHTSREVVSRVLKILEKKEQIELGRNKITLK